MATFAPVELPVCEPGFRLDDRRHQWAASEAMRALVTAYGSSLPEVGTDDLLAWLDAFSGEHWDFRRAGRVERDQVRAPIFDAGLTALIGAAATALGMVEPAPPPRREYDHLVILGGLGRACLQRTQYAAELVRSGAVTVSEVAALGSFRPLDEAEKQLPGLAGAGYEVDAMKAGARIAGLPDIHVLAAPSSEPGKRRANTADTYEFWAGRVRLRACDRVLVVTSPIYVPFQHCDAIRMIGLRHGCGIDPIGFDPDKVTVPLAPGATGPDRYLQEIRSGILSMKRLHG
jgi:hypothetical protein